MKFALLRLAITRIVVFGIILAPGLATTLGKIMRDRIKIVLLVFFLMTGSSLLQESYAQTSVITNVRDAIKAGSSRELTRHFNDMVELNIEGKTGTYTKEQATFVLKEFFDKYPSSDFQYIHQGASEDGTQYAIGRYSFDTGSFRVFMLVKKVNADYKVKLLNIAEE